MTLPTTGTISFSQVNTELALTSTATIDLNASSVRTLFGKSSGAISMSDGRGKSNGVPGIPSSKVFSCSHSDPDHFMCTITVYIQRSGNIYYEIEDNYGYTYEYESWANSPSGTVGDAYWVSISGSAWQNINTTLYMGSFSASEGTSASGSISFKISNSPSGTPFVAYSTSILADAT